MKRGSEQLNPIQITDDFAAFFCISINISFPKRKHIGLQSSSSRRNSSWTWFPFLPCSGSSLVSWGTYRIYSSVYFLKMRGSDLCFVHDVDGPQIYIVRFSSYSIYRDVFISFCFPIWLKKSWVWTLGGYTIAVSGVQGEIVHVSNSIYSCNCLSTFWSTWLNA